MEGELQHTVGRNLRRLRSSLGLSQEAFGEHVGWHRTFVGAVERGERNLTLRTVERIAEQLRVEPQLLLVDAEATSEARVPILMAAAEAVDAAAPVAPGARRSRPVPG